MLTLKNIVVSFVLLFMAASCGTDGNGLSHLVNAHALNAEVLRLAKLTKAPVIRDESGQVASVSAGELKTIYYDALEYEGKPTRVYAWIGIPKAASAKSQVPGIVLVHGGGGSAFKEWVQRWNARGYAAISMAVEGQTDERYPRQPGQRRGWRTHDWPGPKRAAIYGDSDKPLKDQWMYHAVADTILANSLLRSLPQVDKEKVGLMGISWGGVITSTVIGIDSRFAFAVPTYGCGNLSQAANQYGLALGENEIYKQVWDPILRLNKVKVPTLWLSWPGDQHFPLDKQASCYRTAPGPHMASLIPGMKHGHKAGWKPPDSYAFADSIVKEGKPWSKQTAAGIEGELLTVKFKTSRPLDEAMLISTTDIGITGKRKWISLPAKLEKRSGQWVVTARLGEGTTACFVNVRSDDLTVSSDYMECR